MNNFQRTFEKIQRKASVRIRRFHDLRNTALTNWFANGMSEYDVMKLAGHADFKTTHQFYLAVADDLIDRARTAASIGLCKHLAHIWRAPTFLSK
ncbi:MAG: tyrosine-type recombinase/integrase [Promethearchaeota archaeon]